MKPPGNDYSYIIGLIQMLDSRYKIRFFITSKDFDVLYRWWEKGIPTDLVAVAMAQVIERRRQRGKPVDSFSNFSYEVRKRYLGFLTLQTRDHHRHDDSKDMFLREQEFLAHLPGELEFMRAAFAEHMAALARGEVPDTEAIHGALIDHFREDAELEAKTRFFLQNLAPSLRKPELERTYRLNFLLRRYDIPFS